MEPSPASPEEAAEKYQAALLVHPDDATLHNSLGVVLQDQCQFREALTCYQKALTINPRYRAAHINIASLEYLLEMYPEAISHCLRALEIDPDSHLAAHNLGMILEAMHRSAEAITAFQRCLDLAPGYYPAYNSLGTVLLQKGKHDEALACFRKALELKPDNPDAHFNLSLVLLTRGELERGWREYEWRLESTAFRHVKRDFTQPRWTGDDLGERTLLLYAEQGIGDTIQFIRYVPRVMKHGGKVILECPPPLTRLLQHTIEGCDIVSKGNPLPPFDVQCSLLSLPSVFHTTSATIPCPVPYLWPSAGDADKWQAKLTGKHGESSVGLVWSGNPANKVDYKRSIRCSVLSPLTKIKGVRFYSLQKNASPDPETAMGLIDFTPDLHDFSDTAAFIAHLDLVISVDTSVAHLAGAMGKPVWLLLPFSPDFRWMLEREDSPWYPTLRIFRQTTEGDWEEVLARVEEALSNASPLIPNPGKNWILERRGFWVGQGGRRRRYL